MSSLRPRLCVLEKAANGYGFHLHGDKGKSGQFIRLVEPDTPAAASGLRAGDRLAFVNGESVEGESHQQVVSRIRETTGALEVIVLDADTSELLQKLGLQCRKEFVTEGIPAPGDDSGSERADTPREATPVPRENGDASPVRSERLSVSSSTKDEVLVEPRPRLCLLKKNSNGYGFNLHSDKTKPGQYIRAVDEDSPAERGGLRPSDKIVQVNGASVVGMQHSDVVAAIKAGGDQVRLLVVDADAEDFFKRCNVLPTEEHLAGSLPEPTCERASEDEQKPRVSGRTSDSSASSNTSLPNAAAAAAAMSEAEKEAAEADSLGLGLSAAQVRERALQKRAGKKAPPMDWSKKNELFSNL